jgi:FKBP-type peptidyl-prolyl cis-trans isomerase
VNEAMNKLKSLITVALLLLTIFVCVAESQTKKGTTASRRTGRRPGAARIVPKPSAPCPASLSTTTSSGLTYVVTRQGTGQKLKAGDTVIVQYTGLLTNGTKFDSSLDRNQPFEFPLGAGRVIRGWDEGIAQLRVGDQAMLIIPPQLGYGAKGAGDAIPPGATLIFIVEVVGIKETSPAVSPTATPDGNQEKE